MNEHIYVIDNQELSTIPKLLKIIICVTTALVMIILFGGAFILYLTLEITFLETIIIGSLHALLVGLFTLYVYFSKLIITSKIYLRELNIQLENQKGKKCEFDYDKVIKIQDSEKVDKKTGKPYWSVVFIGNSMLSSKAILLTPENASKFKEHLDELEISYRTGPW